MNEEGNFQRNCDSASVCGGGGGGGGKGWYYMIVFFIN